MSDPFQTTEYTVLHSVAYALKLGRSAPVRTKIIASAAGARPEAVPSCGRVARAVSRNGRSANNEPSLRVGQRMEMSELSLVRRAAAVDCDSPIGLPSWLLACLIGCIGGLQATALNGHGGTDH